VREVTDQTKAARDVLVQSYASALGSADTCDALGLHALARQQREAAGHLRAELDRDVLVERVRARIMSRDQNKRDDAIVLAAMPGTRDDVRFRLWRACRDLPSDWAMARTVAALRRLKRAGKVRYVRPNWERV